MGLFGMIGSAVRTVVSVFTGGSSSSSGGGGGSYSSSRTIHEPDKVKIAEIERDTKVRLAKMEADRQERYIQAQQELLQTQRENQEAIEMLRLQGQAAMVQRLLKLQDELNEIAQNRLLIIEKGSMQLIKEMEDFYDGLGAKIKADNDEYSAEKLPKLLELLSQYEEGSAAHELYKKRIESDMELQAQHFDRQIMEVASRQNQIIAGFIHSKDRVLEQTAQITQGVLEKICSPNLALNAPQTDNLPLSLPDSPPLALPAQTAKDGG